MSYRRYLALIDLRLKAGETLKLLKDICALTNKPSDRLYHAHCARMQLFADIVDGLIHKYRSH